MYSKGHTGLTLILVSLLMLPFGNNEYALFVILLSAGLSALPDIDMEWRKSVNFIHHRGVTHSIFFAFLAGVALGALFYFAFQTYMWTLVGFASAFLGVVSHLIGDTFTYHRFKPLWPIRHDEIAFKLCAASDRSVNDGLMTVGVITFVLYYLAVTGELANIISNFL